MTPPAFGGRPVRGERGEPLDVVLCGPAAWPEVRRGTERVVGLLAPRLAAHGVRPRVLAGGPGRRPRRADLPGVPVRLVPRAAAGRLQRRGVAEDVAHLPAARAALALGPRPDVVHALHPADAWAATRRPRGRRPPVVASLMGIPDRRWAVERRGRLPLLLAAVHEAEATVALSETAAARVRAAFGGRPRVIAPPVDTGLLTPGGQRAPEPTILCPADAAVPRKRVGLLLGALAVLRRRGHPGARLVLSRPRDPDVAAGLAGHAGVVLADLDDDAALRDAYRAAWCTALVSEGEAFGLVLVESMACGTPVLAARHGALPEVVADPRHGVLAAGDDVHAVADGLADALAMAHDDGVAAACRAHAETFSAERCAAAYAALHHEVAT